MSNRWERDDVHGITTLIANNKYDPSEEMANFLIRGVVHRSITLIFGPPEGGKSTLARTIGAGLANGSGEILGKPNLAGQLNVAVIAADPDAGHEYREEFRGLLDDDIDIPIHCPDLPVAKATWEEMHSLTSRNDYQLVIVDNLTQFVPGGDLDDSAAIQAIYHELRWFDNHQVAVVLLAHSSIKSRTRSTLGHTTIHAGPRWECQIDGSDPSKTRRLRFKGNPREGQAWSLTTTLDGPRVIQCDDAPARDEYRERQPRHRNRKAGQLEKIREFVSQIPAEARGNKSEVARRIAGTFGINFNTARANYGRGTYGGVD